MVSRTIKRPRKFASYRGKQKKGLQEGYPDKSPDDEVKKNKIMVYSESSDSRPSTFKAPNS